MLSVRGKSGGCFGRDCTRTGRCHDTTKETLSAPKSILLLRHQHRDLVISRNTARDVAAHHGRLDVAATVGGPYLARNGSSQPKTTSSSNVVAAMARRLFLNKTAKGAAIITKVAVTATVYTRFELPSPLPGHS